MLVGGYRALGKAKAVTTPQRGLKSRKRFNITHSVQRDCVYLYIYKQMRMCAVSDFITVGCILLYPVCVAYDAPVILLDLNI